MIEELISLADELDKLGMNDASDAIDEIIKEAAKKKNKKRTPTDKALWARALAEARKKFKVYPCVPVNGSYALTRSGWKCFKDLRIGDEIVSFDLNVGALTWDKIKDLHFYKDAETIRLYKNDSSFDFRCTNDHKWVMNKDGINYLMKTEDIVGDTNILTSARMLDTSVNTYISVWNIVERVLGMSNIERLEWLNNIINSKTKEYSLEEKEAISICAALLGYEVSFDYGDRFQIESIILAKRFNNFVRDIMKESSEKCDVWCPETSSGTWLMRQGGMISITGNSAYANGWAAQWYKKRGGDWRGPRPLR
jgi:hypothetical protein